MEKVKLALVDDHQLFRKGVAALITDLPFVEITIEADNGQEFLEAFACRRVDIVLLDMAMPVKDGLSTLRELRAMDDYVKVVFLTVHSNDQLILSCMEAGAHGFLQKDAHPDEMRLAVQRVAETGFYFSERVSRIMHKGLHHWRNGERKPPISFNDRETDVLRLICEEHTTSEIAEKMCLSPRTIEGYRERLMEKTNARNTVGLVVYAAESGMLEQWREVRRV